VTARVPRASVAPLEAREGVLAGGPLPLVVRAGARDALDGGAVAVMVASRSRASRRNARSGWAFLAPYLHPVPRFVFSRRAYVPDVLADRQIAIVPPSIDAFAAKNVDLEEDVVRSILVQVGLVEGPPPAGPRPEFTLSA
jgi:hypothetical protein